MQAININAIPVDEILFDLGKFFNVRVVESCNEYKVKLPSSIGEGDISGIQFENGLGLLQYNCNFYQDTEIRLVKSNIHSLKFIYVLNGSLEHRFSNEDESHVIDQYQHAIVASEEKNGHILKFSKGKSTCFSSIELDRKKYQDKISCELKGVDSDLSKVFNDIEAKNTFYDKGYYSLKIADIFNEMNTYKNRDFIRKLFLEGFTVQMLAEEILQYEDSKKSEENSKLLTKYELGAIREAVLYIEENISKELNVKLLSKLVGLNQNKLQYGFKKLYGSTVHNYIIDFRLRLVKTLLSNTDLQIGEIADKIGINSKSYFTKIFKERYGLTPIEFKKKQQHQ
ncbi:AraC family transcriptional regulator [Salegentibacter sp. Hel_I_6]|uniref:helix-turn-helix domain-containing protein n=1 Tax=Salegentibacter sp. Hel_I_6 TaxID=1250278 RepID=UPI00055BEDD0|nr:AraC family transcriptional regulator [Salegentibacter sp. Hel_I_6]